MITDLNQRYICDEHDQVLGEHEEPLLQVHPETEVKPKRIDYDKYRPYFLHVPREKVQKTFENSTQFATSIVSGRNIQQL